MKTNPVPTGKRRNAEQWMQIIASANDSGMSYGAFAAQENLPLSRLYYWRSRLQESEQKDATSPAFLPVEVHCKAQDKAVEEQTPSRIEIVVGNGCVVRVVGPVHPGELRQVLALVARGSEC